MSAPEVRRVKRPRVSLSCTLCRSRKVRCGREQPECTNCIQMNKKCVYKALVRDELAGRVRQLSPAPQYGSLIGGDPQDSLLWSQANLVPQTEGNRPNQSHSNRDNGGSISISSSSDPNHPRPREHHMPANLAHPAMHSWEQVMQGPSDQRSSTQNPQPGAHSPGYLSLRRGGRVRYIGKAFWGLVAGQESLSDDFFDENRHALPDLPPPHIAAAGLFKLLRSLPTKTVCDVLLQSFFIAVWPLAPLVHTVTLQAEYDEFWEWCRNSDTSMPPSKLQDDPTFISLLLAVLFCGASAAPGAMWESADLQTLQKETTVNQLKSAYTTSLSMCQHSEYPTFNTLVSTLLTGPFMNYPSKPMQDIISISTIVRMAQTMGLHSELANSTLDLVSREMRRRVWWHIVWLDVQSSISTGLPMCCGSAIQDAVSMVTFVRDGEIVNLCSASPPSAESAKSGISVAMVYATGRFETTRLESIIVNRLQSAQGLPHEGLRELVTAAKQFHQQIDTLMARVPTRGIPEKGLIPARLANASPLTNPSLYKDDTSQPTVFATWTRIVLTLFKLEVAVLLQRPFLQPPDSENLQAQKSWNSIVQLCLGYLRKYLQLHQVPAFSPYMWSYRNYSGPLQCTFLTLIYLLHFRQASEYQIARYCVDEVLDHFITQYQSADTLLAKNGPGTSTPQMPAAIQVLIDLHRRLDLPAGSNELPSPPVDWKAVSTKDMYGDVSESDSGQDFLSILSDLQDWSLQLVVGSERF